MNRTAYIIIAAIALQSCSDWTTPEAKFHDPVNINTEEYYKALREYKETDHAICFGWYSGWTGSGTDMYNQLRGIPDSMDVVSIWGSKTGLTQEQFDDMHEVQRKKGTKVLWCQHIVDIGREITPAGQSAEEYWGWNGSWYDGTEEADEAIRKYARAIVDSALFYGYDGCDFDYEPNYGYSGNISGSPKAMQVFLSEVAKYMGPKSGTGLILAVDGEPQTLLAESGPLLDYYIIQAYYCTGDYNLDSRFNRLLDKFGSLEDEETILRKTVWCEDFERHAGDGGPTFTTRDGITTYSLMGMAMYYRPGIPDCRIGGVGAYRFNLCRSRNDYYFMRAAIQQMNPAHH
ncbi:MAG: glycoside hydrolase family 18 [Candidatus Cryptobacteroides sp.]|nr:glycoside hydrolase family 18 [Bacteroidales bacterium]MDY3964356.1 glycoside hydrolase family 18 [Candidatus Cryptobacteroides sp.]